MTEPHVMPVNSEYEPKSFDLLAVQGHSGNKQAPLLQPLQDGVQP